jgi:hypothetical protein
MTEEGERVISVLEKLLLEGEMSISIMRDCFTVDFQGVRPPNIRNLCWFCFNGLSGITERFATAFIRSEFN